MVFENKIKEYTQKIDPEVLGLNKAVKEIEVKKLGLGESNLNYLVKVNKKQFMFRINIDPSSPTKSKTEFNSLKIVEGLGIAPKPFHYEPSKECFGETFVILEYVEGKSLENQKMNNNTIEELARTVARLHNAPIARIRKTLRKNKSTKRVMLYRIKHTIDYIKAKRKKYFQTENWFDSLLAETFQSFNKKESRFQTELCSGHGDIAPQNVITHNGKLTLIDWEDLSLIDPGIEIAVIFESFDFSEKQKELFLREYLKLRKDPLIRRRIRAFWPFQLFGVFCWAVMHVFEIGEEELHEEFIKAQDLKEHINFAKKMFRKCRDEGVFSKNAKWKSSDAFPDKYLNIITKN